MCQTTKDWHIALFFAAFASGVGIGRSAGGSASEHTGLFRHGESARSEAVAVAEHLYGVIAGG